MLRIDVDSHVAEPGDLWDRYLEPRYRDDHPLRIVETDEGWETLVIDGAQSKILRADTLQLINGMGKPLEEMKARPYSRGIEYGSQDPVERMKLLEEKDIDAQVLLPSLALCWCCEVLDWDVAIAYCRAYNRYIADFSADAKGRLIWLAMIIPEDPALAVKEMERAAADGAKGIWMPHALSSFRSHANPDFDPVWAAAQDLDLAVAIHPTIELPQMRVHQRFHDMQRWATWMFNVCGHQMMQQVFSALFQWGLFDRFPQTRVVLIESGAGWLPHALHRMDEAATMACGSSLPLKNGTPSEYFNRHVWVAADADEPYLESLVREIGSERLLWGSDYPHFDHSPDWREAIDEGVANLPEQDRRNILGENAKRLWKLDL